MKRISAVLIFLAAMIFPATVCAQAYTTITASDMLVDNGSGTAVNPPAGSALCFLGVNSSGAAVTYTPSGGSPVTGTVCQTLTSGGALTGTLQVANPATASPNGLYYTITVTYSGTTYLTIPTVALSGYVFAADTQTLPGTGTALGIGAPHLSCTYGAQWTSTTYPLGQQNSVCNASGNWAASNYCPSGTAYVIPQSGGTPFCLAPQLNGSGSPVGLCTNNSTYLQPNGSAWVCVSGAWTHQNGCSPNTIANGCTGATTAAGANLAITGVTQTGTLGTSSQVSTFPGTVAAGTTLSVGAPTTGQTGGNAGVKDYPIDEVQFVGPASGAKPGAVGVCSDSNDGLSPGTCKNSVYAAYQYLQQAIVTGTATPASGGTIYVIDGATCGGPNNAIWIMGALDPWAVANPTLFNAGTLPSGWLKSAPIRIQGWAAGHAINGQTGGSSLICSSTEPELWVSGTNFPVNVEHMIIEASLTTPVLLGVGSDGSNTDSTTGGVHFDNVLVRMPGAASTAGPAMTIAGSSGFMSFDNSLFQGNTNASRPTDGRDSSEAVVINPASFVAGYGISFTNDTMEYGSLKIYDASGYCANGTIAQFGSSQVFMKNIIQTSNPDGRGAVWIPTQTCGEFEISGVRQAGRLSGITAAAGVEVDSATLPANIIISSPVGTAASGTLPVDVSGGVGTTAAPFGISILSTEYGNGAQLNTWGAQQHIVASGGQLGFLNAGVLGHADNTYPASCLSNGGVGTILVGNCAAEKASGAMIAQAFGANQMGVAPLGFGAGNLGGVSWAEPAGWAGAQPLIGVMLHTQGSGQTPGTYAVTGSGGTCSVEPVISVTVASSGLVAAAPTVRTAGSCNANATPTFTLTGAGGTAATMSGLFNATLAGLSLANPSTNSDIAEGNGSLGDKSGAFVASGFKGAVSGKLTVSNLLGCLDGYDHLPCLVAKIAPTTYSGTAGFGFTSVYTTLNDATRHTYELCIPGYVIAAGTAGTWFFQGAAYEYGYNGGFYPNRADTTLVLNNNNVVSGGNQIGPVCNVFIADPNTAIQYQLVMSGATGTPTISYSLSLTLEQ